MTESLQDLLREHPFTAGLKPEHLTVLAGCAKEVQLPIGSFPIFEGEPAETFYALRDGMARIEVHAPSGGPLVVQTLHGGDVLGWSWLFSPYRWTFDARVLQPVRALAFDAARLRAETERDHELGYELLLRMAKVFTGRLAATRMQLLDLYGPRR